MANFKSMMEAVDYIRFNFRHIKPITVNHAYYLRGNKKILNATARKYREQLWLQMEGQRKEILNFTSKFDKSKHCLNASIEVLVPEKFFFTKEGHISARSIDIDNIQKLLIDFTTNKKFQNSKFNAPTLGIDDKFITYLETTKVPGFENWTINLTFEIKNF